MNILRYIIISLLCCSSIAMAEENIIKLSPKMREEAISNDKYTINVESILPHLKNALFFDTEEQFKELPVVSKYLEDNIIGGEGNQCFVHGAAKLSNNMYTLLRKKNVYQHPETGEVLGIEFVDIGTAKVAERGKILTKMDIVKASGSIEKGDRLTPRVNLNLPAIIKGKIPLKAMQGYILDVEDGLWDMGKYNNIIISLGIRDGVEQGTVLNILRMNDRKDLLPSTEYKKTRKEKNAAAAGKEDFSSTKYGELLVYKAFDKVSLCIVITAKYPITVLDVVKSEEYTS